ncbi:MAG: hypothetical protein EBS53_09585 [Bacteroidetes bacterium]|nr:hypothetical protein [Bacteroidota bacterium]
MMNNTVTVELPVATDGSESTGGKLGYAIGTLLNLKRMIELNDEYVGPLFTKQEMLDNVNQAIAKLDTIHFPYAV